MSFVTLKKPPNKIKQERLHHSIGKISEKFAFRTFGGIPVGKSRKFVHLAAECASRYMVAKI